MIHQLIVLFQYVHRCGRAGRKKVSGTPDPGGKNNCAAYVYSFFHRELAPMAKDVIDLLKLSGAWIDPNLLALVPGGHSLSFLSKRGKRKKKAKKKDDSMENKVENFEGLDSHRIVLKKADA